MNPTKQLSALLSDHAFETLFADFPEPAFAFDLNGKFMEGNQSLMDTSGYSRKELTKMVFSATTVAAETEAVEAEFAAALLGETRRYRCTQLRKDGSTYRASMVLLPFIQDGQTLAVVGFGRNVEDAPSNREAQIRSEALRSVAGHIARFGAWSLEVPGNELYWSDEMFDLFGFPLGPMPTLDAILALFPESDRLLMTDAFETCRTSGTRIDQVRKVHSNGGEVMDVRVIAEAVRNARGRIIRLQGAVYDVTIQTTAEAAQRRVEERLASTMKTISDGIVIVDKDWMFTFVNPRAEVLLKTSAATLSGTSICDIFPDLVGTEFAIGARTALAEEKTTVTRGFYEPLGLWLDVTAYPLEDGLAFYFRDVSEQETSRQAAADSVRQLSAQARVLDVARDAIVIRGMDHTVTYWNRAAADLYGWSEDELLGTSHRDLLYPDLAAHDAAMAETVRDGYWRGELEQYTRGGERIIADCSWTLVRDEQGNAESILAVNADVTEKRRIEASRLRTQRMESLGTLAGGVAHDLNNVLTPILMSVQLLASSETDPGRNELLDTMEASVKRGAEMIRQILSFARGVEGRRIEIDINSLLADLFAFCKESLARNIEVVPQIEDGLWNTIGDPTQLLQVLTNLVNNARDVLPEGGRIGVSARNVTIEDEFALASHGVAEPGNYVLVQVEDNGPGMPPGVLDRIFEPFFTTKGVGEGTGLGLATSIAIIHSHGGYLHGYSEVGHGSRFHILVPAILLSPGERADSGNEEISEDLPRGKGELILVVDDEVAIRHVTCRTLESYGYQTVVAGNGAEAISLIESEGVTVDLMLTDMMMPIMDGATAAALLHKSHPNLPIVAMSGLIANSAAITTVESGVRDFLPKPFTTGQLLRAIRRTIGVRD